MDLILAYRGGGCVTVTASSGDDDAAVTVNGGMAHFSLNLRIRWTWWTAVLLRAYVASWRVSYSPLRSGSTWCVGGAW